MCFSVFFVIKNRKLFLKIVVKQGISFLFSNGVTVGDIKKLLGFGVATIRKLGLCRSQALDLVGHMKTSLGFSKSKHNIKHDN